MTKEQMGGCVLVTGGSGLVGRAIAEEVDSNVYLKNRLRFIFLSSKDADLTDSKQTEDIFKKHNPKLVINLAAKVNSMINNNVLHCSSKHGPKKCISCLSTCIFPDNVECPLDETKIHLGPPHSSNVGYSLAKRQVDLLNKQYNASHRGSLFTAIIPTNIYGRYDNFNLEKSHVIPGLIHKAYLCASEAVARSQREARLKVCGSGKPVRQFIYAPDLAKLILWALDHYNDSEPIILSPDETEEISIGDVAQIIADIVGERFSVKITIEFDRNQDDGQHKKTASNGKLKSLYPEFRFTPIEIGVREVVDWFCLNYANIRK